MNYIFYRVDNDSNDDCGYGAVKDGNNCRGNLEEKKQATCANTQKRHQINRILIIYVVKNICIIFHALYIC